MIKIGIDRSWNTGGWDVYAHRYTPTGRVPFQISVKEMPEVAEGMHAKPAFHLDMEQGPEIVRALLDALTEAGLMPALGATEAELKATIRHLEDLRALTFEQVKPKPEIKP